MNKIIRNASWIVVCKIIRALISLLMTMLTARYFGPSNFGLLQFAAAIVVFVEPIMQLGLNETMVREFVEDGKQENLILGSSILMSLLSALLCMLGVLLFSFAASGGDRETVLVCGLYSVCLLFQAAELTKFWFQYKYLSKYSSIVSLIAFSAVAVYRFVLLAAGMSIYWFAIANALDFAIIAAALYVLYRKLGGKRLAFSWEMCKKLFRRSRPYIVAGLMVTVFAQTDKIMLKLMMGDAVNGYYSAAVSCANMCGFVFVAIIDSMRPAILESRQDGEKAFEKNMALLYSIIIYLSLFFSLGISVCAGPLIRIIYGSEYLAAINPLRLILWYTTFAYLGTVRNVWILAKQRQRYLGIINLCGALGNVALNFLLIPRAGAEGAALASLITQIFTNVVMGYIIKPLRENNSIMIKGLDFRILGQAIRQLHAEWRTSSKHL